jgi:hypothetical protein
MPNFGPTIAGAVGYSEMRNVGDVCRVTFNGRDGVLGTSGGFFSRIWFAADDGDQVDILCGYFRLTKTQREFIRLRAKYGK